MRYLTGAGDWVIDNDADWSSYMKANDWLKVKLYEKVLEIVTKKHIGGWQVSDYVVEVDETFHMDIQNGEGIVGYQYLHGTNGKVGDFNVRGTITINTDHDGIHTMVMNLTYTWNDVIDPNPQYSTDVWKSGIAELITLGFAEAYNIHISWTEPCTLKSDMQGNMTEMTGFPFQ